MFETRHRLRTLSVAAAALLLTATVVDIVVWSLACRRLDDSARDAAAAAGWTLSSGATQWGGWPAAAEIILPDAILRAGPDIIPPLTWTAPQATLRLSAFRPKTLTASATGAQTLAIGAAPAVPFMASTLLATIDLTAHDPVRIAATALKMAAPDGPVRVASADLLILPDGIAANLSGMTLPGRTGQPISPPIDMFRLEGHITPPIEPQPTASESALGWRAKGGQVNLSSMSLRWGPLDASARATLTLDPDLQPAIVGQITATGLATVIEQLAQTGAMPRSTATAAQGMLTILSAPTGGGPVTLPITLQAGIVSVARIPLLRLAPLQWN